MSVEGLILLLILCVAILGVAYAITYALGKAGSPTILSQGVWVIAALILLLILLRQTGILHVG